MTFGLDSNSLEYFNAVARSGAISRAACELGMESSTLTRHIGRLETDIGVKLFHRSGRGMLLTDAGAILLKQAEMMVNALDSTRRVAAELASEGPSQIIIATQPTIAQMTFGPLAHVLRSRFPSARTRMVEGLGHQLVQWLQDGQIDVAILYVPIQTQIIDYDLLLQEPLYCVSLPDCNEGNATIDLSAVLDRELILPSTLHGLRALVETWAERRSRMVRIAMECDGSTFLTRRLVQAGLGSTILPLAAVYDEVQRGTLQAVRIEGPEAVRNVAIATARNRMPVKGLWEIVRAVRQVTTEMVKGGRWPGVDRVTG